MNPAATHALQERNFRLDGGQELSARGLWYDESPLSTHLLNAYTLLVPEGERFIIRTCRRYLGRITLELKAELETLFFQEGSHSREHQRVLKAMQNDRMGLDTFRTIIGWICYRLVEPVTPLKLRLATASAIEHHNAAIATFFLNQELLRHVRAAELRRLFLWHFIEEIEHKETVFKLLQSVSPAWSLRVLGLFFSFSTFLLYLLLGTIVLGLKTRSALSVTFWRQLLYNSVDPQGLFVAVTRESLRYLKPNFRPSLEETRTLLSSALTELEHLGVERPKRMAEPCARPLPPKFQKKVKKTMERVRKHQSTHSFFFNSIEKYDGAWLQSAGERKLNFCTYSYLGLLNHPLINAAAQNTIERYGTGTHGVRLLGGNLVIHEQLESRIASFFSRQAAITFSSGFMTNLAVIGTLVGKGDYVLADELVHASIVDGCRFSRAEILKFRHNDANELARKLAGLPRDARKLIVVDAVYSMDGDIGPVGELIELRNRHDNTLLMVDEAHSLGVLGKRGRGVEEHFGCVGKIDVLMGTLSKAIPSQGGYIAGSHELIHYLRYSARGFVFSAALSPVAAAAAHEALQVIEREGEVRRRQLMSNARYLSRRLRDEGFNVGNSESAIVPVLFGNEDRAFEMARRCHLEGIYVMPVAHPAVPKGEERLRMNVTCEHQQEDLDYAVESLRRARTAVEGASPSSGSSTPAQERS